MSTRKEDILHVLSYFAVVFAGLALLLSVLLGKISGAQTVAHALDILAQFMAYIVVICLSFGYARTRGVRGGHSVWWLVVWACAAVLLVVFFAWNSYKISLRYDFYRIVDILFYMQNRNS